MQTMLFLYNRHAGKDRNWTSLSEIIETLTQQGYLVTTYPSQYSGDVGEAARRWGANYDRIVVAGGDGTLNQVVSGLLQVPNAPPVGYIPVGTTNDFSRNLSLPGGLLNLAETAANGVVRPCDVGRCNGRTFLYVAAFGAFTEVSYDTPQKVKNLLGYTAYLLESVKYLGSIKPYQIRVEYEDQVLEGTYLYGMVSNSTSVGRFRNFPPGNPLLDDGLLEVTLISPPKDIFELEQLSRMLLLNGEVVSPMLTTFSTAEVTIICDKEIPWTVDGEFGGAHTTAEIEVIPHAFTVVHGE